METVKLIIEAAGIVIAAKDMTVAFDERGGMLPRSPHGYGCSCTEMTFLLSSPCFSGAKYDLPLYVLSLPTNLVH